MQGAGIKRWIPGVLVAAACAAATYGIWGWVNRPVTEPPWPNRVQGMAFSPFRADQDGKLNQYPTRQQVDEDLKLLAGRVFAVRTYGTGGTLGDVPELAEKYGISVAVGAWLDKDLAANREQVARAIELANTHRNVVRVFVGNEVLLRDDLSEDELIAEIERVKRAVSVPVGTADPAARISSTRERTTQVRNERSTAYVQILAGAMNLMPRWYIGSMLRKVDFLASDVPGLPVPVYLGGAKVKVQYAFGPTIGAAVNVTLLTYVDTCALGIDVDTGAIPDFEAFYDCLVEGFDEVLALAD